MKLYYSPGTCSLAPHIALREAGVKFDLVRMSLKTHTLADGSDYYAINPKGSVPMLETDDGARLTESQVILQYIGDHAPASGLAPAPATMAHYRLIEWLSFISTELHKGFSPLFNANLPAEVKPLFATPLRRRFEWLEQQLEGCDFLTGERFSLADAYLFTVMRWAPLTGVDLAGLKNLAAYAERVAARPAVQESLRAEGPKV